MPTSVERCPLCESPKKTPFEAFRDGDVLLRYYLCANCGMVYQSPRMDDRELDAYYARQYRFHVQGSAGPTEKDRRVQAGRARHLVEFAQKHLQRFENHLDIGSSAGSLLLAFSAAFGSHGIGVEPGDD